MAVPEGAGRSVRNAEEKLVVVRGAGWARLTADGRKEGLGLRVLFPHRLPQTPLSEEVGAVQPPR